MQKYSWNSTKDNAKMSGSIRQRHDTTRCKRHPKHQQAPGVCSLCLHEKLSKIYLDSRRSRSSSSSSFYYMQYCSYSSGSSSSSSLSSSSSSSGSSMASPDPRYRHFLLKRRSIGFVQRRKGHEMNGDGKGSRDDKRLGFWSRLMSSRQWQKRSNMLD